MSIGTATGSGYTVQANDVGATLRARVTASNLGGSGIAESAATAVVPPPPSGGSGYRAQVLGDGPVGYWRLGELSGLVAADESGGVAGGFVGGVTLAQSGALLGDGDRAASFDGINDYVLVPSASSLDLTVGVTIEVWVKRSLSGVWQVIVGKPGNGQSRYENYALWLDTGNRPIAYFGNGVGFVSVAAPAIDTGWHHVVATYDNATARIYLDGVLKTSAASTVALTASPGALNIGRATTNNYFYGGLLDEIAIYPRALTAQQIQTHYTTATTTATGDTTAPVVSLTAPVNGSSTTDTTPTFAGVAGILSGDLATVTVRVYSGSTAAGTPSQTLTATRAANGSYSIDASTPLAAGVYTAQASQSDSAGNTGLSTSTTFTVTASPDTTAPVVSLTAPVNGSSTTDTTPTFAGVAGILSGDLATVTVRVYSGSTAAGTPSQTLTATRAANGSYSIDASTPLAAGVYTAQASQSDSAGNTGLSTSTTFTVTASPDTTAPVVSLTAPVNGSSTTDTTPTFAGVAGILSGDLATVTVRVYSGSTAAGTPTQTLTATRAANGSYSIDASTPLAAGVYTAQASQSDSAGNTGLSASTTFTVTAPPPSGGSGYRAQVLGDGPVGYWRLGELSGLVAADESGGVAGGFVGGVTLAQSGALLGDGDRAASFDGINDYVLVPSASSLDLTVGVTIEVWVKRSLSGVWQVIVGKPGNGQSRYENYALWLDTGNRPIAYFGNGVGFVSVAAPAIDTGWHHVVATYDNATARIYLDGVLKTSAASTVALTASPGALNIGRATTNNYFYGGLLDEIAIYPRALTAQQIQTHYTTATTTATGDTTAPVVSLTAPVNGSSTTDTTPTFAGVAGILSGDLATVTVRVYSGSTAAGTPSQTLTATRAANGSYSIDASTPLAAGVYTAQASQSDSAGNTGLSTSTTFTVTASPDTTAPVVSLTAPVNGSSTTDTTPTFAGVAGILSGDLATVTVRVYSGSTAAGTPSQTLTATRAANGSYSIDASTPLAAGVYTAQASQSDSAGNTGLSTSTTFTVTASPDTTAPVVSLTAPVNGSSTTDTTPTFAGVAGILSGDLATVTVRVYSGSTAAGTPSQTLTATRAANGSYSIDASTPLAAGVYTAQASQSDSAGNTGLSTSTTFTVTAPPPSGGSGYRAQVLGDGPVGYWRLGELSGLVAADESGGVAGGFVGGVTLAQSGALLGDGDRAASFDGINDYVLVPSASSLDLTVGVTIEVWVKRSLSGVWQVIVGKPGNGQSRYENYALWLDTGNRPIAYFGNGVGFVSVAAPAIDTGWHHVVATYDNATARIYLDGVLKTSAASTVALTASPGALNIGRATTNNYFYGGLLDEIAIYPRALTAQQIQTHYTTATSVGA